MLLRKPKNIPDETKLLVYYDPGKLLILPCDATLYGLSPVLSHQLPGRNEKPVTFASLSKGETN